MPGLGDGSSWQSVSLRWKALYQGQLTSRLAR